MATRIELNLPPRLLESARATQAANQRQLLNREQQTKDAREVRRQLRQAEAQGRTVRGREQEQRGNGVPEFPLSEGDWLPRRGSLDVAYGYQTTELSPTSSPTYTLWSGNGQAKLPIQITPASSNSEPVDVPNTITYNTVTKRYSGIPVPELVTYYVDFDSSGTPFTSQVRRFRSTSKLPSIPVTAVFPVKPGLLIASTAHAVTERETVETWRYQRIERAVRWFGGTGAVVISNGEIVDWNAYPQLWNYDVTIIQSFSWSGPSISTTETRTQAPTSSYLISLTGIRPIATPAAVHSWLSAFTSNPDVAQGLGTDLPSSILGTPETIAAAAGAPESWSQKWLQLRRKADDPTTLEARQITALDPITHKPLDPSSGALVPSITVPARLGGNVPPGQALLLTWDWGKPALCRQLLLQLGFSPADLTP